MWWSALLAMPVLLASRAPDCAVLLDGLHAKVVADYAGYRLEVAGTPRQASHDRLLAALRRRAAGASRAACFGVLRDYVAWFDDPHLFLYQSPRRDSSVTQGLMASVPRRTVDTAAVRRSLVARGAAVDPIEGFWYDGAMELAVVPDRSGPPGRFLAVVTRSDTVTLPEGAVRAVFTRRQDGGYETELRWRSLAVTRPPVTLHRGGTMLRLSPGIWGKRFPGPAAELALLDGADVHRPTLTWRDSVAVISVPSHDYANRAILASLIARNRARLDSASLLVIDLRGNEGGSSVTTSPLDPYLVGADSLDPSGGFGAAMMLASADQVRYARRSFGPDTSAFVRRLVAAMEAAPGQLVPLFDSASAPVPGRYPPPIFGPRRVAVLIDRGTVSASEVLVRVAKQSDRAVVLGQPTAGALDYQNVNIVRIDPDESYWLLGYPAITASARLPEGGIRGKGIAPDIAIDWASVDDPVAAAVRAITERL